MLLGKRPRVLTTVNGDESIDIKDVWTFEDIGTFYASTWIGAKPTEYQTISLATWVKLVLDLDIGEYHLRC